MRLANAKREMEFADTYDVRIVNDSLDDALCELEAVLTRMNQMKGLKKKCPVIKPEIDSLLEKDRDSIHSFCAQWRQSAHTILIICFMVSTFVSLPFRILTILRQLYPVKDSISVAMNEVNDGTLGFVKDTFDDAIKGANHRDLTYV